MDVIQEFRNTYQLYRLQQYQECLSRCNQILQSTPQPSHKGFWYLKMECQSELHYLDDLHIEEESKEEALFDDYAVTKQAVKPGTSLNQKATSSSHQGIRPVTASGRPITGVSRPQTSHYLSMTGIPKTGVSISAARNGMGEFFLDTKDFIDISKVNVSNIGKQSILAKSFFKYLFYTLKDFKKALDLAQVATNHLEEKNWWWEAQLGRCYYMLGLLRESEKHLKESLQLQETISTTVHLAKLYIKLDQPVTALSCYEKGLEKFKESTELMCGMGQIHDLVGDFEKAGAVYKQILGIDPSHVESIASISSHQFYSDQPEVAILGYRRLVQMGLHTPATWNNLALSAYYGQEYETCFIAFKKAIECAFGDDIESSNVWYNLGQIAGSMGDLSLAFQCYKIAISINNRLAEAWNNLGVIEKFTHPQSEAALSHFTSACQISPFIYEPHYNEALSYYLADNVQMAFHSCHKSLLAYPNHHESHVIMEHIMDTVKYL